MVHIKSVPIPEDYDISKRRGFLPDQDPLQNLSSYYASWDAAVKQLPSYLLAGCTRKQLDRIPLLSTDQLTTEAEFQRAYSVLCMLSHAYVWCDGETSPCKVLPANLAVPWAAVSAHLGGKPILTHSAVVMYNWHLIDSEGPADLTNLAVNHTFNGCNDEAWFYLVTVAIEALGGPTVQAIVNGMHAVNELDAEKVAAHMHVLADSIESMTNIILRMFEKCDATVYYRDIRPFFGGWRGNPVLPNGLVYEGVSDIPFEYAGGSAGQSSLLQAIDIALGIHHSPTNVCPMQEATVLDTPSASESEPDADAEDTDTDLDGNMNEEHLAKLRHTPAVDAECSYMSTVRAYMPRKHRHFLSALGKAPSLHDFVKSPHGSDEARAAFDRAVLALSQFRTKHIQLVSTYIVIPASKKSSTIASYRGTGGSSIMPFLKQVRTETLTQLTQCPHPRP
ncbi:hypothetical protein SARC_03489 [Sphaeroforma arctica JP610]|uniref:Indoleamine 2,3-dioxygenase n=1 Tax=Sphaeroforma arctica JP610 TaxID=667725 RepID=A0A0L0G7S4_9EUKA|nr:hypothetical protein SARC_03489 [Sphaeroforma arctica JP610]KNC84288.1 hypothetical protein SARC_03489 [Sphaeroforma arctica JP610]|eukprot:XP_014158190.1 hypothetical protein SARC_03489 [Sphaeroforma arctica JP610]